MSTKTTFLGSIRSYGARRRRGATPGSVVLSMYITCTPSASELPVRVGSVKDVGPQATLPKGAVILSFTKYVGTSTGTNPTFSIGTVADTDGFLINIDSDASTVGTTYVPSLGLLHLTGVGNGLLLDSPLVAINGTGTQGTGQMSGVLQYMIFDDGKDSR